MVATTATLPTAHSGSRLALLLLALIALLAAGTSLFVVSTSYMIDDSFIYYRYAKNLFDGHGVVYNAGDRVEGYTSLSHIVLPWLAFVLRADPLHFMQGLGLIAQAIALWLTWRIGIRLGRSPLQALLAPLLLATSIIVVTFTMSGMPMALYYAIVAGAAYVLQGGLDTRRSQILLGIMLAAITLTRFDGFVVAGVIMGFVVLIDRRLLSVWPTIAILGGVMLAYNLWRISYYPTPMPNTYYAKMGFSLRRTGIGWVYLQKFLYSHAGLWLLIASALPFVLGRARRGAFLLGWVALAQLCYVAAVGGDWMNYSRFVLTVLPLIAVLAQEGVWSLTDVLRTLGLPRAVRHAGAAGLALALVVANALPLVTALQRFPAAPLNQRIVRSLDGRFWSRTDGIAIAQHIDQHFPDDWKIALEWAGLLPYHFHQPVVDMFGLNDARATQMGFPTSDHGLNIPTKYITDQKPAVVIVVARLYKTPQQARQALGQRMNQKRPQWVYDLYNPLDKPPHDYEVGVTRVGGRYWAMLKRQGLQLPGGR